MSLYYTKKGDGGYSSLMGGRRISKNDPAFKALGGIDELNSWLGICRLHAESRKMISAIDVIQNDLFSISAALTSDCSGVRIKRLRVPDPGFLESEIARLENRLPRLSMFVIPRGAPASAHLHFARTLCRRMERDIAALSTGKQINPRVMEYVNRLSSFLFVAALCSNKERKIRERNPKY